jgi:glycosyltransferase involved in cell wall biosynthesis
MARVIVLGSLPESLLNFRGPLLRAMVAAGHEVHAASPPAEAGVVAALAAMGVRHHAVPLARASLNPLRDLGTLLALFSLFRRLRPDHLLAYTIKPVIYGGLAARLAGVPRYYAMITGLGYSFAGGGLKCRLVGRLARALYRASLAGAERVLFQNRDNLDAFTAFGLLRDPSQACLTAGSGVDLTHFAPVPLPDAPKFLMVARLLHDKGVLEYVEAARRVKSAYPQARFRLAGWIDENPSAVSPRQLDGWIREGVIEYLGRLDDVRPAFADARVYCLPSYHEGMPRTVLEAMAMGRPVITTRVPGCRDTVREGGNGYLVPARDAEALAEAMTRFIATPELAPAMGAAGRRRVEEEFDVNRVNRTILEVMGLA